MYFCQFSVLLIGGLHSTKFSLNKIPIQEQCTVLTMIVIVLRIGNAACIAYSHCASLIYHMRCMAIDHRLQTHFFKLEDRCFYHPFKTKTISDIYCFLFCDILPSGDKSDPIAFCIGRSHLIDLFLRKGIQKLCNSCFIL